MVIRTKAREAWDVCKISAWMDISFWAADLAKTVLCVTRFPKVAWRNGSKRGYRKPWTPESCMLNGTAPVLFTTTVTTRSTLRIQLDAGMPLSDYHQIPAQVPDHVCRAL